MSDTSTHSATEPAPEPRPIALLAGMATGFASVSLTLGTYWIFAPLFPAIVAAIAALLPLNGHRQFARGALAAVLGVAAFVVVFVPVLLIVK